MRRGRAGYDPLTVQGIWLAPDRGLIFVKFTEHRDPATRALVVRLADRMRTDGLDDRLRDSVGVGVVFRLDDGLDRVQPHTRSIPPPPSCSQGEGRGLDWLRASA